MIRAKTAALLLVGILAAGEAAGHGMPNSTVQLAPAPQGVVATLAIPMSELEAALGRPARGDDAGLRGYLREHVAVESAGVAWPVEVVALRLEAGDHPTLRATLAFARPPGAAGDAELRYDAVTHRIASHYVLVYWQGRPLVRLQPPQKSTAIPLRSQSP